MKLEERRFNMNVVEAVTITRKELDKHGLVNVRVVVNNRLTRAFGRYRYQRLNDDRRIELSRKLVELNDVERVTRTILHEVAHALTEGHGHDSVWKAKCLEIGGDGIARYSTIDTNIPQVSKSSKIYRLHCPDCGVTQGRYRRKMNGYKHRTCTSTLINIEL